MGIVLLVAAVVLLVLPGLARPWGLRVAPPEWARLCTAALAGGAVLLEMTLALYAAPTVLQAAGVSALAAVCERMLGPLVPGGDAAGWAAAAVAVTLPTLAAVGARRALAERRVLRAEPWLGEHSTLGDHELVVLPTAELLAVGVPGPPRGQVVVSEGLVAALEADELEAVLRHETAHLDCGHDQYLLLATAVEHAFAFFPPVRWGAAALRATLERWADEAAAGSAPQARHALCRALVNVTSVVVAEPSATVFATAETVMERIDALDSDEPRPTLLTRAMLYVPGTALAVVIGLALVSWSAEAQDLLAMAGVCSR